METRGSSRNGRSRTLLSHWRSSRKDNNKVLLCSTVEVTKGDPPPEPRYGHSCCLYTTNNHESLIIYGGVTQDLPSGPTPPSSAPPSPQTAAVYKFFLEDPPHWKQLMKEG